MFTHLCEIFHSRDINNIDRQFQRCCCWRKTTYFYVQNAAGPPVITSTDIQGEKKRSSMRSDLEPGVCESLHLRDLISISSIVLFTSCFKI